MKVKDAWDRDALTRSDTFEGMATLRRCLIRVALLGRVPVSVVGSMEAVKEAEKAGSRGGRGGLKGRIL